MKQKSGLGKAPADQVLKDIRRQTRRQYSAEEKIRIRAGRTAGGGEYLRALPARGHCRLDVLRLVQGVPRGRQAQSSGSVPFSARARAYCLNGFPARKAELWVR